MLLILQIIGAVVVFSLLITIHELGHLWAARMFGVKVHEFAIGMGPVIFKWGKGETEYTIRCLPLGGFARMDEDEGPSDDPRAFVNAKPWARIVILMGGGIMNLLAGLILCIILVSAMPAISAPVIGEFSSNSAIEQAGVPVGSEIVRINGTRMRLHQDVILESMRLNDPNVVVQYRYDGELRTARFEATFDESSGRYLLGYVNGTVPNSVWNTLKYGSYQFVSVSRQIILALSDLVTGRVSVQQMAGPVGIVGAIGSAVGDVAAKQTAESAWNLTSLFLLITINLGIFNLIPFPALDGSRIVFVLIEMIRRKPIRPEVESTVHFVGFALLMLLVVFATGNDISRLITGS